MQNKILVVDGDTRSLRLLEVSLVQVGYRVVTATSGADALSQLEVEVPDSVLADTDIGAVDGFALYQKLQAQPAWAHLPFIFILDGENPAEKLRAVQLGASDFLTKPVFLKEALSRVELLLEKHAQRGEGGLGVALSSGRARFAGALSGTALLDLLQTMELGRKSGIAYCTSGRGQRAVIYFSDGAVVDAELGRLSGEAALYRVLTFQGGEYRVELLTVVRPPRIELGTAGLLMEAMRHLEEWNRLGAALPPLTAPLSPAALGGNAGALRPEHLPGELREVLWRFDGQRSVLDVLDLMDEEAEPPHDALRRLGAVAKLYAARLLVPAGRPISGEPRASVPTPIAVPRLLPPAARLTPPPLPRLTPPPFVAGRSSTALAGLARPTPVALPRAVVFAPAPLLPAEHRYPADVPTGPMSVSPSSTAARPVVSLDELTGPVSAPPLVSELTSPGRPTSPSAMPAPSPLASQPVHESNPVLSDEYPTPLPRHFPPTARQTPVEFIAALPTARLTPPPLPSRLTPPSLPQARLTPPPLSQARLTPAPLPQPRLTPSPLPQARLTPPPLAQARLTPAPLPQARLTLPPMPQARLTPPPLMQARLTPAPLSQARLTPPPIPGRSLRSTPPMLHTVTPPPPVSDPTPPPSRPVHDTPPTLQAAAHPTPLPITDSMVMPLPSRPVHRTPPMLQAAAHPTPLPITDSMVMPLPGRPGHRTPPTLQAAARLTPLPITDSMVMPLPSRPVHRTPPTLQAAARLTPLPITDSMVMPLPSRPVHRTPPTLQAAARLTPLPITDSMVMPLPERPVHHTPPALLAVARPPLTPGRDEPRLTPAPELDGESAADASVSSTGTNLARLAQRLAATRQPLPFTPPPLPSFTPAVGIPTSEPTYSSPMMWTGSGSSSQGTAAAVSWIGSAPELEPISLPEFEVTVEHSAPSWGQAAPPSGGSAAPQRELRLEKTLSVHARPQRGAGDDSQAAVHISAPVRLPAEVASMSLSPIALAEPAAGRRQPVAAAPVVPGQRLGKAVAWIAAGAALFGLGMGLFWVRQELERGQAEPPRESAWTSTSGAVKIGSEVVSPERKEPPVSAPAAASGNQGLSAATPGAPSVMPAATPSAVPPAAVTAIATPPVAAVPGAAPPTGVAPGAVSPASPGVSESATAPAAEGEYLALIAKARGFERRGSLSQAHHAIRDAQRLKPRGAEVFALLAQLALDEGNADKAAGLAKRALLVNPSCADAYLVLGTVEQARGHGGKARDYFKKYLALAPAGDRAHDVRAVLRMGH